jgi:hypothetical protein
MDSAFGMLRGLWQFCSPSARREHINSGKPFVRLSCLLFYGFIPRKATRKKHIDLLWIGRTTLWKGQAFFEAGHDILYIYAQERKTREHKVFIFYAPGLHDPSRSSRICRMKGVIAGTVLDDDYHGQYPVTAATCVARKLEYWSEWFKKNDCFIDSEYLIGLRERMEFDYFPLDELRKKSHNRSPNREVFGDNIGNPEYYFEMADVLKEIYQRNGLLSKSIIFPFENEAE